ncbi:kunitz trypsin inhibitor 5-like [Telopea speciosissima]|uniref:kunitz trypsin inhibitor 5-like n=1 Tax=Telopea speciosissima TaxID=54955 RepID=UPI001CC695E3|nr:kunitz trypsin inhibitor 5-like [Telopea speciosissima]
MWNRVFLSGLLILASLVHTNAIPSHSHHHHSSHSQSHSAVLDTNGNELQAGMPYYIVSAIRGGGGGGLSMDRRESSTSHGHTTHTPTVRQSAYDLNMGTPVMFSPASPQHPELALLGEREEGEMMIQESMDMNIRFSGMNNRVWQVEQQGKEESSSSRDSMRFVTLGGKPGYPGESTVRNWFKIERMSESTPIYRIVYCPNVCESCQVICGSVGITKRNGNRWLSVSEHSEFPFVFVRAQTQQ